jgi:wyosine [tRNA(Phe)-imidazoG37] synthetase (radical SAM superfamily)
MSYVFGPVQSRRLGRSLGIDLLPHKTCNWNCVYCQLGRTQPLTNTRREYRSTRNIASDIRQALQGCREKIDWITFVGSGEPTLHIDIGWLIREVKDSTDIPVAVITNGSLLHVPEVARALAVADAVLPSLDAGEESLYRAINRPHPHLPYSSLRRGLAEFRESYRGHYWVEVMLVAGMNDTEPALRELAAALGEIAPDEVHISTPFRAAAEQWVRGPAPEAIALAKDMFGTKARVLMPATADVKLRGGDALDTLADVIARHPMGEDEVRAVIDEPGGGTRRLAEGGRVQRVCRDGRWFWCPAEGHYGNGQNAGGPDRDETTADPAPRPREKEAVSLDERAHETCKNGES